MTSLSVTTAVSAVGREHQPCSKSRGANAAHVAREMTTARENTEPIVKGAIKARRSGGRPATAGKQQQPRRSFKSAAIATWGTCPRLQLVAVQAKGGQKAQETCKLTSTESARGTKLHAPALTRSRRAGAGALAASGRSGHADRRSRGSCALSAITVCR
jgi:hypothetical protein